MKLIHILVEGQTEEAFVKQVLVPYLEPKDIFPNPVIVKTKRVGSEPTCRGGDVPFEKFIVQVRNLLSDTTAIRVTTLVDYYALGNDFPGRVNSPTRSGLRNAEVVEDALADYFADRRFLPYLQVHEFEALLFTDTDEIANQFADRSASAGEWKRLAMELRKIRQGFPTPEEINDSPGTCPSARLHDKIASYRKILHGPTIVQRIGIRALKRECLHFRAWIEQIEGV